MNYIKKALLLGAVGGMGFLAVNVSFAQSAEEAAQAPAAGELEEITVNARRVKENLQDVPITVQAFSNATLTQVDTHDIFDLATKTPAVTVCCSAGLLVLTFVRGIQDVVTYFDDAPINQGGSGMFFDLDNAQVLKGPQGTLFGLSSDGGAILFQPKQPTNKLEGYSTVELGDYGRRSLEGAINIPIVDDKLLVRVGVKSYVEDGYIQDLTYNRTLDNQDWQDFRAQVTFRPTSDFENRLLVNYYDSKAFTTTGSLTALNPTGLGAEVFGPGLLAAFQNQQRLGQYQVTALPLIAGYSAGETIIRRWNSVDTLNWNITDGLAIHNVFGWENLNTFTELDPYLWNISTSGSLVNPTPIPHQNPAQPSQKTWTEDFQLRGKVFDNTLSYVFGTYWSTMHWPAGVSYSYGFNVPQAALAQSDSHTKAVYGQGTYSLSQWVKGLSFTAGYRYTWDTREAQASGLDPNTLALLSNYAQDTGHFSAPSYTLVANYEFTPGVSIYFNNSKGYSSGGLQLTAPPGFQTYQPQSLNNFEIGLKSEVAIGESHLRANIAAYYGLFDNVQAAVSSLIQVSPPPAPPQVLALTENAAQGRIKGIDMNIAFASSLGFDLSGDLSMMDDRYTRYNTIDMNSGLPANYSGVNFLSAPGYKFTVSGTYHLPVPQEYGRVSTTAVYSYTPRFVDRILPVSELRPDQYVQKHDNLDLSLDWNDVMNHTGVDASVFVQNATNNHVSDYLGEFYENLGYDVLDPAPPRQYGVRLTYKF